MDNPFVDSTLINEAMRGDPTAVEELYRSCRNLVKEYVSAAARSNEGINAEEMERLIKARVQEEVKIYDPTRQSFEKFVNAQIHHVAYNELYRNCSEQIYGYIRVRVSHDEYIQEILRIAEDILLAKMPTYDPQHKFSPFAKIWVEFARRQFFARPKDPQITLSQLEHVYPDIKNAEEIFDRIQGDKVRTSQIERSQISQSETALEEEISDEIKKKLLWITFHTDHPPHELIVFGFNNILDEKPRVIVDAYSDTYLRDLEKALENRYIDNNLLCSEGDRPLSELSEEEVRICFKKLRENMESTLREVVHEAKTLQMYPHLQDQVIGNTVLNHYYSDKDKEANRALISRWCDNVQRRVRKEVCKDNLFDGFKIKKRK